MGKLCEGEIMIKVVVKNLLGEVTHNDQFPTQAEAEAWVQKCEAQKFFGKPERWVHEDDLAFGGEDRSKAVESQLVGAPDDEKSRFRFVADYTVQFEDVTAQFEQDRVNAESVSYLASTDWYVIRYMESAVAIPDDVVQKRAQARAAIVR